MSRHRPLPREIEIELGLDDASDEAALRALAARRLQRSPADLPALRLRKRSLDARRGAVRFHVLLELGGEPDAPLGAPEPARVVAPERVVIVGAGPAGLFAAYQLARQGIGCTVVDRGKLVQPRRHDLKALNRRGTVDVDSNYCFGEGGAGTYSDGKLYTRAHKRGNVRDVLELLVRHGAPPEILTEARPHIGSNRLPKVLTALREHLLEVGVQFRWSARVSDLVLVGRRVAGLTLQGGERLSAERVILATGHSATDVHDLLERAGVRLEPKPFALGVRIEHPQPLINRIQYGAFAEHPALPNAAYRLAQDVDGRGVFSFCMCPGGWIVPATTEPDAVVVNGMSLARRDSPFANSGLVVGIEPEDAARAGFAGARGGSALQREVERAASAAGGGLLVAPATRVTDFLAGRGSTTLPDSSYIPGLAAGDVAEVLARSRLPLAARLRRALASFERKLRGYVTEEAVLVGVESRTSSPVRVPRDRASLESPDVAGLFPAGEGAGYAGGIMSAAVDGMAVAARVAESLKPATARSR